MKEFDLVIHGNDYNVKILSFTPGEGEEETVRMSVNDVEYEVVIKNKVAKTPIIKRVPVVHNIVEGGVLTSQDAGQSLSSVKAPLPGVVVKINSKPGDLIKMGETVLVLEAMKMQNEIQAPRDGRIKEVNVKEGQNVFEGESLIVIE